jgi:PST family polysaccharide transporter
MKLASLAVKSLKWSSISRFGRQLIQYITTLILAFLLSPEDFGLIAIAFIIIGFLDIFKDLGTSSALIYIDDPPHTLLSSIFWVNVSFGMAISILIFLTAPLVADFFSNSQAISVLKVLSISFTISSFGIVQKALLEREFKFDLLARSELLSVLGGSAIGITLAFLGYGVWSLVIQALVSALLFTVFLWFFGNWKPELHFSLDEIKTVFKYSLNLLGYNVFNYFVRNMDYILIGKFLGERELGHYYLAYKIMLYPVQNISLVVSRVMFPIYSRIKDDNSRFRKIYTQVAVAIALITFPLMAIIMGVNDIFTLVLFSVKWDTDLLALLLIILAPVGMVQSIATTTGSIYQAKGKTDWMFRWGVFTGFIVVGGFVIGLNWGVTGVAVSYLVTTILLLYPVFAIPFKLIGLRFGNFISGFFRICLTIFIMIGIVMFSKNLLMNDLIIQFELILLLFIGLITYIILSYLLNKSFIKMVLETIKMK